MEREMDNRLREVEINLGRVAQRVDDHEGDIHRFAGLPAELHEIRWGQDKMRESLDAAHGAIRDLSARLDREHEERIEGQLDRKRELDIAREERDREIRDLREADERRKAENRRNLYVLAGVFLAAVGQVISGLIGGPTP